MFTEDLKNALRHELKSIEEGIAYMELNDTAYTRCYTRLVKRQKLIKKTIKKMERMDK